jgi:hypothetical protein
LQILLVFNIAYDTSVRLLELQRVNLSGCYMIICYTGARPAELVDNERKPPKDGSLDELFGVKAVMPAESEAEPEAEPYKEMTDKDVQELEALLLREVVDRGRQKALCYEDILMMVVRHPVTGRAVVAMSIKFIFHKGCDNKPKPYVSPLTTRAAWASRY